MVVGGFGAFLAGYLVYSSYLGAINGLPPLPEAYWKNPNIDPLPPPPERKNLIKQQLQVAFGVDCPEVKRPIQLGVPSRGLILVAEHFAIEPDGRVKMSPLSMVIIGKAVGDDKTLEMNTLRSDIAYLTFERPIASIADVGKYRIVAGEITGNIEIVNNRKSLPRDDDVIMTVANGPLYYDLLKQKIWTKEFVHLQDLQSKPEPMTVTGKGLEVDLLTEQPNAPQSPARKKKQSEQVSGVKEITLHSSVTMNLFADNKSGFLGGTGPEKPKEKKPIDPKKPDRMSIIIQSHGPFRYDVVKDFARFDIPTPDPANPNRFPEQVTVSRVVVDPKATRGQVGEQPKKLDQLICEHLELQFKRREAGAEPKGAVGSPKTPDAPARKGNTSPANGVDLEIETAHATGNSVTLASDTEILEAHGVDFFYDARIKTTTLKGSQTAQMWALKEGNHIQADELRIEDTGLGYQKAKAIGKGILRLFDKTTGKRPVEASWDKELIWTKDGELEMLHLVGKAVMLDNNQGSQQDLRADDLKIWLENKPAADKAKPTTAEVDKDKEAQSRRPHHLIAAGHVKSKSKEFNILDADRFVVWFKEGTVFEKKPATTPAKPLTPAVPTTPTQPTNGPVVVGSVTVPQAPPAEPKNNPIDLSARTVEAYIVRQGDKSDLDKMRCEGAVRVHQDPRKPGERGVNIKGDTLSLTHHFEGNVLVVTGDERELAELVMDKMAILGPEVNVDQVNNKAWVNGVGAMQMESETDFQGKRLTKPVPLTIHWDQSMIFNGNFAEFHGGKNGGVQADQGTARMACQSMQVFFDRPISLKEGDKSSQGAKVRNLVCDRSARVEDSVKEKEEWIKYTLLEGSGIMFDNEESVVQATGPGQLRILQRGGEEQQQGVGSKPAVVPTGPATTKSDQPALTYVTFQQRMSGDNKTKTAHFYVNVRVLHMPSNNPRQVIDLEKLLEKPLAKGVLYIRCDRLTVLTREAPGTKTYQEMRARGRVSVQAEDFSGSAAVVTYDEEKDQVIFDGTQGGVATLYKMKGRGEPPDRIQGEKIIYSRQTGQHTGVNLKSITGGR